MDLEKLEIARENLLINKMAFSVKEEIEAKKLINDICENSNLYPLFKSTSAFSFNTIKNTYGSNDVDMVVKSSDVIKYNFTRTPI